MEEMVGLKESVTGKDLAGLVGVWECGSQGL